MKKSFSAIGITNGRRMASVAVALACVGVVAALFQNCTEAAQIDQGSLYSKSAALGFAYSARYDQIAYMSCNALARGQYDSSAYFTIRAGAYRSGGMGLTDVFWNAAKNMSPDQRAAMLALSPLNGATTAQLSMRTVSNVQARWSSGGTSATDGADFDNFFDTVGQSASSLILQAKAPYLVRTLPTSTGILLGQNRFEGSIMYGYDASTEQSVRDHLQGLTSDAQTMVSLTYADTSSTDAGHAKSPGDPNQAISYAGDPIAQSRYAYGRGLILAFRQPAFAGVSSSYSTTTLSSVSEIDLQTRAAPLDAAAWTCPNSFQFRIVRLVDAGAAGIGGCPMHPDPETMSADLQTVRRSLRVEDWWVNMDSGNPCIVPKKTFGDCYGAAATVQYGLSGVCGVANGIPCTAFASVCYRTQ